jgi:hypothetical protein
MLDSTTTNSKGFYRQSCSDTKTYGGPRDLSYTKMLCVLVMLATSDIGVTNPRPEHHRQAGQNTIGSAHLEAS